MSATTQSLWSTEEIRTLADRAYQQLPLRCPRCNARVRAREAGYLGRSSTPLDLSCERCGASAEYSPDHLEEMKLKWTQVQMALIKERYWERGYVNCPDDGARLKILKARSVVPRGQEPQMQFRCPHCGRHFWSQHVNEVKDPDSFDAKYETLHELGRGGMGSVDLARHIGSGDLVAAKRIQPQCLGEADTVRRFKREGRILEKLKHPNVVSVRETFINDKGGVIVMDYVDGGTLTRAINEDRPSVEMLGWFDGMVTGLSYLHEQGVVHRDLKPDNILLDGVRARISDFGLALLLDRDTTTLTVQGGLGTWLYAAPEQHDDPAGVTAAADIYALGVIAYECATRRSPYRMPMNTRDLSPELDKALSAALHHNPAARPKDGRALLEALTVQFGNGG